MANEINNQGSNNNLQDKDRSGWDIDQLEHGNAESMLLTVSDREVISRISEGDSIHSQRAKAILVIDAGATQAEAGEQTGLTRGHVRYWLEKFRIQGLEIFPQDMLEEAQGYVKAAPSEAEVVEQLPAEGSASSEKPGKKKTKAKKPKKSRKVKGKRKSKKRRNKPKGNKKKKKKKRKNKN